MFPFDFSSFASVSFIFKEISRSNEKNLKWLKHFV